MLFTRVLVAALSFAGLAAAAPLEKDKSVVKRDSVLQVVQNLQANVAGPIAALKAGNADGSLTEESAITQLTAIRDAIGAAQSAVTFATPSKRDLLERDLLERQAADLQILGAILAQIITDLVEAIEGIVDDLKGLPLIGALIIAIDGGLSTLLLGVQLVLAGVVQVLQGLLAGLGGLLASLGTGLLAGIIFG